MGCKTLTQSINLEMVFEVECTRIFVAAVIVHPVASLLTYFCVHV